MPQGKKMFITGGSGYIGSVIIEQAIAAGYSVTALSRSESSDEKLKKLGASPVRGDLETYDVLTREAAAADVVISLADSIAGQMGKISMEERFRINNAAIDALAKGLIGSGKAFIVTSGSLSVAADPNGDETDETGERWTDMPFGDGFEGAAMSYKDQGVRVVAIRLAPWVYGRGGSGVKLFMEMYAKSGSGFYLDEGAARTTTVHVEDAARLYLLAAEKGRAGEAYNATFETTPTHRQLAEAFGAALGVSVHSMPYADAEATMGRFFAKFLSLENRASNKKAKTELGWEPKAEKGILEEIANGSYVELAKSLRKTPA